MAKQTVVSRFQLRGREILSSYASFTLEGEITARVTRGTDSWTITERNGIPKGTSDGANEAPCCARAATRRGKSSRPSRPRRSTSRTSRSTWCAAASTSPAPSRTSRRCSSSR